MRRRGRETALQILFQLDFGGGEGLAPVDLDTVMASFWRSFDPVDEDDRAFAERLVRGVMQELGSLDARLEHASTHWRLARMDRVDRSVLRLAAYELLYCPDVPRAVVINEAVDIAKRFSTTEASAFVNGVLDHLSPESDKA